MLRCVYIYKTSGFKGHCLVFEGENAEIGKSNEMLTCSFSLSPTEIAQMTSYDSGIAETPETDDSVSIQYIFLKFLITGLMYFSRIKFLYSRPPSPRV